MLAALGRSLFSKSLKAFITPLNSGLLFATHLLESGHGPLLSLLLAYFLFIHWFSFSSIA
jgi:uncharacterized membrane protein